MIEMTDRARAWRDTMQGYSDSDPASDIVLAHSDSNTLPRLPLGLVPMRRQEREEIEDLALSRGATRAVGGGNRRVFEEPDLFRTCFERDRDRILHRSTAFRRLAGKTQVFIFPHDHMRTRLTHALEVTQVARALSMALRTNVALTEAIALGHDCGHGPFGHASEDALSLFLPEGFDHAVWGADVVLAPLNLCEATTDAIRNHSWSRPSPSSIEGEIVSWADRIAYVCHDFEDAVSAGIVSSSSLPKEITDETGHHRGHQLDYFISDLVRTSTESGRVAMSQKAAAVLAYFREFNYASIYNRPASLAQAEAVLQMLRALVNYYADRPGLIESNPNRDEWPLGGSETALRLAVNHVGGMTDRYAIGCATSLLGWDRHKLPKGIDTAS